MKKASMTLREETEMPPNFSMQRTGVEPSCHQGDVQSPAADFQR